MMLNTAVLAPMPRPRVTTAEIAKPGLRERRRHAKRRAARIEGSSNPCVPATRRMVTPLPVLRDEVQQAGTDGPPITERQHGTGQAPPDRSLARARNG